MRKTHILGLLAAAMLLAGCNDDIFVKPEPAIDDVTLAGNGGTATVRINKKELKSFGFYCKSYDDTYCHTIAYGHDGRELTQIGNIEEVAKVRFFTPCFAVDFLVKGDEVTIKALDNTLPYDIVLTVSLNYGYGDNIFDITLTPGEGMLIENVGYGVAPMQTGRETHPGALRTSMTNTSDLTQHMEIRPYEGSVSTVLYESSDNWETGVTGEVAVPYYSGGEWLVPDAPNAAVRIGYATEYRAYGFDPDITVSVEVPPRTKKTVEVAVTYATCLTAFSCEMVQPNSGIGNIVWGTCQIKQPVGYKISETCEKL